MSGGFGGGGFSGGGFNSRGSARNNVNRYYTYNQTKGNTSADGCCITKVLIAVLIIYLLMELLAAGWLVFLVLVLPAMTITLAVFITHKAWNALCKGAPNRYFRRAAKIAAGYLAAVGFFAVWIAADDFLTWEIVTEDMDDPGFVILIVTGIIAIFYNIYQGNNAVKTDSKESEQSTENHK